MCKTCLITCPRSTRAALASCVQDERIAIIRDELKPGAPENERSWDVLLTTYEVANIEKTTLNKIGWRYLIIDEAHRWVSTHVHWCLFVEPLFCCGVVVVSVSVIASAWWPCRCSRSDSPAPNI